MKPLTIGNLAQRAGVGIETVRFYERQGLLDEPERRASGYRQYGEEAVAVLRFIRRAKELGFKLKEIKALLEMRLDATASRAEVRRQARAKVADIEARIAGPPAYARCVADSHQEVPRRRDHDRLPDPGGA